MQQTFLSVHNFLIFFVSMSVICEVTEPELCLVVKFPYLCCTNWLKTVSTNVPIICVGYILNNKHCSFAYSTRRDKFIWIFVPWQAAGRLAACDYFIPLPVVQQTATHVGCFILCMLMDCICVVCWQNALRLMAFHKVHCVLGTSAPSAPGSASQQSKKRPHPPDSGSHCYIVEKYPFVASTPSAGWQEKRYKNGSAVTVKCPIPFFTPSLRQFTKMFAPAAGFLG